MNTPVYYKPEPCNNNERQCICIQPTFTPAPVYNNPNLPWQRQCNGIDTATYAQYHRRLEAMQHAMQSHIYRQLSGF